AGRRAGRGRCAGSRSSHLPGRACSAFSPPSREGLSSLSGSEAGFGPRSPKGAYSFTEGLSPTLTFTIRDPPEERDPAVQTSTAIPPLVTPADGPTSERPEADREIVFSVSDL